MKPRKKVAPQATWHFISHNVWGVGGPLPLTTPLRSTDMLLQQCLLRRGRAACADLTLTDEGGAPPVVVCVQEAFTSQTSVFAFALCLVLLQVERMLWRLDMLVSGWRPAAALLCLLKIPYAAAIHAVYIGPPVLNYPANPGVYGALAGCTSVLVSALLALACLGASFLLGAIEEPLPVVTKAFQCWLCFWLGLSVTHRWAPRVVWCTKSKIAEMLSGVAPYAVGVGDNLNWQPPKHNNKRASDSGEQTGAPLPVRVHTAHI
jgi:hypothetical protein